MGRNGQKGTRKRTEEERAVGDDRRWREGQAGGAEGRSYQGRGWRGRRGMTCWQQQPCRALRQPWWFRSPRSRTARPRSLLYHRACPSHGSGGARGTRRCGPRYCTPSEATPAVVLRARGARQHGPSRCWLVDGRTRRRLWEWMGREGAWHKRTKEGEGGRGCGRRRW